MKQTKLKYRFHNPNSDEVTADLVYKILMDVNSGKVERAIREAALQCTEEKEHIVGLEKSVCEKTA